MSTPDDIERICDIMTRFGATRVRLGGVEIEIPRPTGPVAAAESTRVARSFADELPTTMDELRAAVLPSKPTHGDDE